MKAPWRALFLVLVLSTPVTAFAQRTNKFVDTFDQRYPVEQAPTPPSAERDDALSGPGVQQTQNPKPAEPKKVLKVARATRTIGTKRSTSRLVAVSRLFVDAGTKVLPSERKSVDYIFQRMYSEWVVVRWASGDCKIWHNDTNRPAGYGWNTVAFANTSDEAYLKMMRLYRMGECVWGMSFFDECFRRCSRSHARATMSGRLRSVQALSSLSTPSNEDVRSILRIVSTRR